MRVYHITHPGLRESISKSGLLPKTSERWSIGYGPRIFFFIPKTKDDIVSAFDYTKDENMDIWEAEIEFDALKKDTYSIATNHFWIDYPVEAKLYKKNIDMWDISIKDFICQ